MLSLLFWRLGSLLIGITLCAGVIMEFLLVWSNLTKSSHNVPLYCSAPATPVVHELVSVRTTPVAYSIGPYGRANKVEFREGSRISPTVFSFTAPGKYDDIVAYYTNKLTRDGWTLQDHAVNTEHGTLHLTKYFEKESIINFGGLITFDPLFIYMRSGDCYALDVSVQPERSGNWVGELKFVYEGDNA